MGKLNLSTYFLRNIRVKYVTTRRLRLPYIRAHFEDRLHPHAKCKFNPSGQFIDTVWKQSVTRSTMFVLHHSCQ